MRGLREYATVSLRIIHVGRLFGELFTGGFEVAEFLHRQAVFSLMGGAVAGVPAHPATAGLWISIGLNNPGMAEFGDVLGVAPAVDEWNFDADTIKRATLGALEIKAVF